MEVFSKYQPLFMEAISNNRIGLCKWIESGTTLDTALPELSELTDDKEEWRAVIVLLEDEQGMKGFERDVRNPFDFAVNSEMNETVSESEIPLIRLTHMLGGVPAPEMKFVSEKIIEEHKAPRVIYKPVIDKEQDEAYKKLCRKYEYDGKLPSSIIMISIREGYEQEDNIDSAWQDHKESGSSEFWKRNHYPSICRFLVYDFQKRGPVQRNADEFGFWLSTLLLSTNVTDSGTLQAYRLYKLNTKINKKLMGESFHDVAVRLKSARHVIEKDIRREIESQAALEEALPGYRMDISVNVNAPKDADCAVDKQGFGLLSKGVRTDIGMWNARKKETETRLETAVRTADRQLDQTADKMRDLCSFTEDEVSALSKYQREDLTRETGEIYHNIVTRQGDLPTGDVTGNPAIVKTAEKVMDFLRGRVAVKPALWALGIAAILVFLGQLPAVYDYYVKDTGDLGSIFMVALLECLVIAAFAFVLLWWQKLQLNELIEGYNVHMRAAFARLIENAGDYSAYLSDIASHSRGHSYLNLSKMKKHQRDTANYAKFKHIKAINILLAKLKSWANAYHLRVDIDNVDVDENITVDVSVPPAKSSMYTFETGNSYQISVNNSGIKVYSPFEFVEKLEIVREELYDDGDH